MDNDVLFKAVADPTRRLILDEFTERTEQTLYELSARLVMKHKVTMSRQAIAKHVRILEKAGLLRSERRGKYRVLISDGTIEKSVAPARTHTKRAGSLTLRIIITSIFVDDQNKALNFYTKTLGFIKKNDVPAGKYRWLTVVSPDDPEGTELLLEPSKSSVFQDYKKTLMDQAIPAAMFGVDDVESIYGRLAALGVTFIMKPTQMGDVKIAVFDDTCGNLIQIMEKKGGSAM